MFQGFTLVFLELALCWFLTRVMDLGYGLAQSERLSGLLNGSRVRSLVIQAGRAGEPRFRFSSFCQDTGLPATGSTFAAA